MVTDLYDFGGPYPDGNYNLIAIDQRTRYLLVEVVFSTGFKQTKEKLKKTFAYLGIRQTMDHRSIQSNLRILQKKKDLYIIELQKITLGLMGRWRNLCRPLTKQNKFPTFKGSQDQIKTWLSRIC